MSRIESEKIRSPIENDKPRENCAVVGVYAKERDVSSLAFNGLVELNHRGQEGAGIAISNGNEFSMVKDAGLVDAVFSLTPLPDLEGALIAIGHARYSTSGSLAESQPFYEDGIAIAHNGNLTNINKLRMELGIPAEIEGAYSDTRAALAVINKIQGDSERQRIKDALNSFEGAYSFVIATNNAMYAARDPLGFRPLSFGKLRDGNGYVVASETCAFNSMDADYQRDILPGELLQIDDHGLLSSFIKTNNRFAHCIFELIYVSRPDSTVFGIPVTKFRLNQGEILSRHLPDVDIISPVPRSGIVPAQGLANSSIAREKGIPYQDALYTNPYRNIGKGAGKGPRTFIQPIGRDQAATEKYSANSYVVKGKRIALVDDSIVRGSLKHVAQKLRDNGAIKIHGLIAAPQITHPCYYGIDMSTREELIANQIPDLNERAKYLGLDSLYYSSWGELMEAVVGNPVEIDDETIFEKHNFCGACFTGNYPTAIDGAIPKVS